jgi:hypothetical protein
MGTGAANFGGLVSAFHLEFLTGSVLIPPLKKGQISVLSPRTQSGEPPIIANFINRGNPDAATHIALPRPRGRRVWGPTPTLTRNTAYCRGAKLAKKIVDKVLINYNPGRSN